MAIKNWAIILGGSSGIGLAAVEKLAAEGFGIISIYRERRKTATAVEEKFEKLNQNGASIIGLNTNALNEDDIKTSIAAIQKIIGENGKINVLVHAIARGNLKPIAVTKQATETINNSLSQFGLNPISEREETPYTNELNEQDYMLTIQAMATSLLTWVNTLRETNLFAKDTRVIGLTSEGNQKAWKGYGAVSAAKVTLEAIARSMAVELAPLGIRTNIIQPGITDTPSLRMIPNHEQIVKHAILRNPFHRLTTPQDVANVIFLLTKKEASWINGSLIKVDGGEQIA